MRWAGWLLGLFVVAAACGGSSQGNAGTGVGGTTTPDGGSGGDAGTGTDGGVAAECADLVPATPGSAFSFDVLAYDNGETCDASAVDGEGVVAAAARGATSGTTWYEFVPNYGGRSGNFGSEEVFPQPKGFIGLSGPTTLMLFGQYGEQLYSWPLGSGKAVLGPASGSAGGVISLSATATSLTVRKHDAGAVEVSSATISGAFAPRAAAEDASGAVLALVGSGAEVSGLWIDLAKGTAGPPFPIASGNSVRARPLLSGGVAVAVDGRWAGVAQPGDSSLRAAPGWLGAAADFAPARSGKAYALLPQTGNGIGIVSSQGNACGSIAFPGVSSVSVGPDGTVAGATGPRGCTKYVWRNALR